MRVTADVDGLEEFDAAVRSMQTRVRTSGRAIVRDGLSVVERAAKGNFRGSHPPGFPHVGGPFPNVVTGQTRRSIRRDRIRSEGLGAWSGNVGPTVAWGRRLELGYPGGSGPGHQRTRPFPYLAPAARESRAALRRIAVSHWRSATNV